MLPSGLRVMGRFSAAMIAVMLCACTPRSVGHTGAEVAFAFRPESNKTSASRNEGAKLYVVNANSTVSVFDLADRRVPPVVISGGGLYGPSGVALDTSGNLYVTSPILGLISVFDTTHGNTVMPAIAYSRKRSYPGGMTVDERGTLYVANSGSDSVSVFENVSHASPAVALTITGGGLNVPWGAAASASGKLYVANENGNSVSVFDIMSGNVALAPITGGGLNVPFGLAVASNGKLYVANLNGNSVSIFDTAHGNRALKSITRGLQTPSGVALDRNGDLYVANSGSNTVSIFDTRHGNATLMPITRSGLNFPYGVAIR